MAIMAAKKLNPKKITGIDISTKMLEMGRQKIEKQGLASVITLESGDSETINFADNTFDGVMAAFGVRNFENLEKGNIELLRIDSKIKDVQLPIKADGWNVRTIAKSTLTKGMYKARIRWTSAGKEYYKEESVVVE
jgi:ubiquinone/menaquinone biosynthesis C-methylase UbiE